MSDIHNHILCGDLSLKELPDGILKQIIVENRLLYDLGCMGGDILFYYHILNHRLNEWSSDIGNCMHDRVNLIFSLAAEFTEQLSGDEIRKTVAYLMGFVNHHALDSRTHPYINYHAGCKIKGRKETYAYEYTHKRFEVLLDLSMADFLDQTLIDCERIAKIDLAEIGLVARLFQFILKGMGCESITEDMLVECLKGYKRLVYFSKKQLYLYPLARLIDKLSNKPHHLSRPFFTISDSEKEIDVLNLTHRLWQDPCDANVYCDDSYPDLFFNAVADSAERMIRYYTYLNDKIGSCDEIFHALSFLTGSCTYSESDMNIVSLII